MLPLVIEFLFWWSFCYVLLRDTLAAQHELHALNGNGAVGEEPSYESLTAYVEPSGRRPKKQEPKENPREHGRERDRDRARDRDPPQFSKPHHRRGEERYPFGDPPRHSKPPHRRGEEGRGGSPPPLHHRRGGGGDDSDGSYEFDPTTSPYCSPYMTETGRQWHKAQRRAMSPPRGSIAVEREFDGRSGREREEQLVRKPPRDPPRWGTRGLMKQMMERDDGQLGSGWAVGGPAIRDHERDRMYERERDRRERGYERDRVRDRDREREKSDDSITIRLPD
eukprot:gene17837-3028_t